MTEDISVIIPTIKNSRILNHTLKECLKIKRLGEIYVVIEKIEKSNQLTHKKITYLNIKSGCNMSFKRNFAAKLAKTKYLMFFDSDSYPSNSNVGIHSIDILKSNNKISAVGGPDISPNNQGFWQSITGLLNKSFFISGFRQHRKKILSERYVEELCSCNLFMKKSEYFKFNGMNENIYYAEDTDLFNRIINKGFKLFYSPNVMAFHRDRSLFTYMTKRYLAGYNASLSIKSFVLKKIKNTKIVKGEFRYEYILTPLLALYIFFLIIILIFYYLNFIILLPLIIFLLLVVIDTIRISNFINFIYIYFFLLLIILIQSFASLTTLFGFSLNVKKIYRNDNDK